MPKMYLNKLDDTLEQILPSTEELPEENVLKVYSLWYMLHLAALPEINLQSAWIDLAMDSQNPLGHWHCLQKHTPTYLQPCW